MQRMKVPRLGAQSEPQLLAYTTTTAVPDPNHVCDLHHSSLSEARDRTPILMHISQVRFP